MCFTRKCHSFKKILEISLILCFAYLYVECGPFQSQRLGQSRDKAQVCVVKG